MLTLDQAIEQLVREVHPGPTELRPLLGAHGLRLGTRIVSTSDSPPFDKSMMDGFAVCSESITDSKRTLRIAGQTTAGEGPGAPLQPDEALRIMTGAPLPPGADAVIRQEDTHVAENGCVTVHGSVPTVGQFIIRQGSSMRAGDMVLSPGKRLTPPELGLLAELGIPRVTVHRPPTVGIIATGNELTPIEASPGPGQIRNSNETMLAAQVKRAGGIAVPLGIAPDQETVLRDRIQQGLECDFLCLSGGVSAGILDLVPNVLQDLGVREIFHKVDVKPGKPIWFGVRVHSQRRQYVFGLPGNPVSSMVCFELFTRLAIDNWLGGGFLEPCWTQARWQHPFRSNSDRPTLFPSTLVVSGAERMLHATEWKGSFDIRGSLGCNAFAWIPPGNFSSQAGDFVRVLELERSL